ncbi:hypothetical protein METBIDRAFT_45237 [Metschnikowia bicuspidata var. bicuspidata NRRL YB-4993]|uniref:Large ribosomal subunit protein mL43 n=1 Tax=Metschnikowia bicuspidata var. bicuspidata NRRL YB-4993 TaxID=869754 RepID=A0A1A0H7S9_9ASCO|nr:hypothetical protein METBIDRAFT_45237 [Metschnikowia bicuspidata var. bicuspidata NRRL YB-4993]OBA20154.1 hypothetical protein METBIDRAFT_45237 [Metschnikowia bicuspidata var. bicuspidata NRRL YB-4993]
MPVKAIQKLSLARNGIGAFVKPCHKITVQFCNWGGSSQGVRDLLVDPEKRFQKFTTSNKDTMFEIVKKSGHPMLTFHYSTGKNSVVDVKNLVPTDIVAKLDEYIKRGGNNLFKFNHKVMSENESVRGVWSPFHEAKEHRHRI